MLQDFWKKVQWAIRIFREDLDDLLYDSLTGLHQSNYYRNCGRNRLRLPARSVKSWN